MPKVTVVNEKRDLEVAAGANLRQALLQAGLDVHPGVTRYLNCRGNGLCGTCRVLVTKGMENLGPKTTKEAIQFNAHPVTMLAVIGHEDKLRLACQVQVNGDCSVETKPPFNWSGENFWQKPYPNK